MSESSKMNVKEETISDELLGEEFIRNIIHTQESSFIDVDDVEIKHEEVDFHYNSEQADSEDHSHLDLETVSSIPKTDCGSVHAQNKNLNDFYLALLLCERDCEACQMYIKMSSSHVRATHVPPQPIQDPSLVDPNHPQSKNQCSSSISIHIKSEVDESPGINFTHLLQCEQDCEVCQKYMMAISEHVRALHVPHRPLQDPLHIDPLKINHEPHHPDLSSLIQIKCEMDGGNNSIQCCEEISGSHNIIHNSEKRFKRDVSMKSSIRKSNLKVRKRTYTRERRFKCEKCGKGFMRNSHLSEHMRTHIGGKSFKCDVCEKCFSQVRYLRQHKNRTHTKNSPLKCDERKVDEGNNKIQSSEKNSEHETESYNVDFELESGSESRRLPKEHTLKESTTLKVHKHFKCDECQKSFKSESQMNVHKRLHIGETPFNSANVIRNTEKPFKCDLCINSFNRKSKLTDHQRMHTGERPFKCEVCAKSFRSKTYLTQHKKLHTGEKLFKCDVCDKSFFKNYLLTIHKRLHTGEKPFKCDVCEKSFGRNAYLIIHKRTHTGDRLHKSKQCEKIFRRKSNLAIHERTHTGDRPFKCDLCERSFTTSDKLSEHKIIHTGESPFSCDVCGMSFTANAHLIVHKSTHTDSRYDSWDGRRAELPVKVYGPARPRPLPVELEPSSALARV